ncbi:hypothetical protein HK100_011337 [Physocladia obscura]|uniref:PH domain-containing protein n=1 Tax=Physocladia obscura TaxID=109957 RepID=A0AAD5T8L6_9FUNG|nr:hypothetical protein HK100_011337 [Physocladia obscura]
MLTPRHSKPFLASSSGQARNRDSPLASAVSSGNSRSGGNLTESKFSTAINSITSAFTAKLEIDPSSTRAEAFGSLVFLQDVYKNKYVILLKQMCLTFLFSISEHLQKFNAHNKSWSRRLFVLTKDGKMYMYAENAELDSFQISVLLVDGCTQNQTILRVSGMCISPDGSKTPTQWLLQFSDENVMNLWMETINKATPSLVSTPLLDPLRRNSAISAEQGATSSVNSKVGFEMVSPSSVSSKAPSFSGNSRTPSVTENSKVPETGRQRLNSNESSRTNASATFIDRETEMKQKNQEYLDKKTEYQQPPKKMVGPSAVPKPNVTSISIKVAESIDEISRVLAAYEKKKTLLVTIDSLESNLEQNRLDNESTI